MTVSYIKLRVLRESSTLFVWRLDFSNAERRNLFSGIAGRRAEKNAGMLRIWKCSEMRDRDEGGSWIDESRRKKRLL